MAKKNQIPFDPKNPPAGTLKDIPVEKKPKCPHCGEYIINIDWFAFAEGRFKIITHSQCEKVIGVTI